MYVDYCILMFFFFSSRRRHTRLQGDWSSDVCSSDLVKLGLAGVASEARADRLAVAARRAVETAVVTRLVLVAYADWRSEIGRGSCRGRVEISVVAVSLKKKTGEMYQHWDVE